MCLLPMQINTGTYSALIVQKHWSTRKHFAISPEPYQHRFSNVSCTWTWRLCGIISATYLLRNVMTLNKGTFFFPAGNNTERQSHAGQEGCQFHLPILYHHLDNFGCIVTTWVRGGRVLLSDTQINIRQRRYIISLEFSLIRRQEQGFTKSQPKLNQPTNQEDQFLTLQGLQCLGYGESLSTQIFPILLSLCIFVNLKSALFCDFTRRLSLLC